LSLAPGLICTSCWNNSRAKRPFQLRPGRKPADVPPGADRRPASERVTFVETPGIAVDEPDAA
jgi:hypothetical protein